MSGNEDHHRQGRRFAAGGNGHDERDPRDVEIERLRQRVRELEINPFDRYERQYEDTPTDSAVEEYENEGEIPEFEGRLCPDDFLDWLRMVDRIFDLRDTPDPIKVKLVAIRLKSLLLYGGSVHNQRYGEGKSRVESWDMMKRLMIKKVSCPCSQARNLVVSLNPQNKQTLTVEEFIAEFERVRMRCGVEENEEQTIARFLGSLRTDISEVVYLQQYYSFHDVCSRLSPVRGRAHINVEHHSLNGVLTTPTTSSLRCFKCQGIGHLKRDCPNKQALTLIDEADPIYDTEDEVETEVVHPDRGELLVTRRLLNTAVLDQDDDTTWLRTNIFRTQCTAKGKVSPPSVVFGLLMIEENPVTAAAPLSMVPLLNEFKDVFPEEIPAGLPVIREIQHCIDFLPGASIPNKPAYRMNPKEFAELHRQVTELLEKGLIREAMSRVRYPLYLFLNQVSGFAPFAHLYQDDPDFKELWNKCHGGIFCDFVRRDGFLFKGRHLCVPVSSSREAIILECYQGALAGHFGRAKTAALAEFAYNRSNHSSTGRSPFFVVYGRNPFTPLDLAPMVGDGSFCAMGRDERCPSDSSVTMHRFAFVLFYIYILPTNQQAKLKPRHAKWVETLQDFSFVIRHKAGSANSVADADLSPYTPDADFDDDSGSSRFLEGEDDTDQGGSPLSPTQAGPTESG
ncbi:reverse transcriptase domain-containing protein [Tanacetum coccineum]